ncbi:hypothetical protein JDV09_11540 [Mycobacterium sp. Y57]|uniref:hypothetical protein n=1 Tax=Mycolicibacterium xanthum TaxID=2796469 RepID=UPI001C8414C2|nr:hypothetical protein [Mycolicibacterium xanthum]MBX7432731.1 hypothetical protein [Mycolicibacterium xanthum]
MTDFVLAASWCFGISGILLGVAALAIFRRPLPALRTMMELFIAAGLLRLSADSSWAAIAAAVVVISLRQVLTRSLTADFHAIPAHQRST